MDKEKKKADSPDLDIMNLDEELTSQKDQNEPPLYDEDWIIDDMEDTEDTDSEESPEKDMHFLFKVNWHIVLGIGFIVFILALVFRFLNMWQVIDLDLLPDQEEEKNTLDYMMPALPYEGYTPADDGVTTIVTFGNAPFADDRDTGDNLTNIISDLSGAIVYNCSVADTYLASIGETFRAGSYPMDAFNFYWLTTLAALDNTSIYEQAFEAMGEDTPEDAIMVYELLTTIDFLKVDVVALMYDGSDYLAGHEMYNDDNPTDITQFTGNMEAGIELLLDTYPHLRIIVISPTYAYALDENGNYVSSDIYRYGQDVLSTYVIKQWGSCYGRGISFVDNLYDTVTEDNAAEYLSDHIHLNVNGRRVVAEKFVKALTYYDKAIAE